MDWFPFPFLRQFDSVFATLLKPSRLLANLDIVIRIVCSRHLTLCSQVLSPGQQNQVVRKGRAGAGSAVPCGPGSPCASKLEELEREHKERLQEMEKAHERERREVETQREQMLREEALHAVQGQYWLHKDDITVLWRFLMFCVLPLTSFLSLSAAIEALRKIHQDELERVRGGKQPDSTVLK